MDTQNVVFSLRRVYFKTFAMHLATFLQLTLFCYNICPAIACYINRLSWRNSFAVCLQTSKMLQFTPMSHLSKQPRNQKQSPFSNSNEEAAAHHFSPTSPIAVDTAAAQEPPTAPHQPPSTDGENTSTLLAESDLATYFGPTGPVTAALHG